MNLLGWAEVSIAYHTSPTLTGGSSRKWTLMQKDSDDANQNKAGDNVDMEKDKGDAGNHVPAKPGRGTVCVRK